MFDRYLVAQTRPAGRRNRRILLVLSVVAHGVLVVGLVVWSFVHVEEVAAPLLTVTFFQAAAPPPPPPPPPPAGRKQDRKPKTPVIQPREVKPLVLPREPEPSEKDEGDNGEEGGVEGGVTGGVAGGVVGGVVGGVLGGAGLRGPAEPPPPKPKNVAHAPDPSEWIHRPDPHVPEAIKIQRKGTGEATFFAVVCLDMSGRVTDVKVKQSLPGADDAIIQVLRTWQCKPQPIPICFPLRLIFTFE